MWTAEISTTEHITKELGKPNIMVTFNCMCFSGHPVACFRGWDKRFVGMKAVATLTDKHKFGIFLGLVGNIYLFVNG